MTKAVIDMQPEHPTTRQLIFGQLMEALDHLSFSDLEQVLFFVRSLGQPLVGVSGQNLLALADLFPRADSDELARIIQQSRDDEIRTLTASSRVMPFHD